MFPSHKWFKVVCIGLLLLSTTLPTLGATITVRNLNDNGPGSLRDTIATASSGDTIVFSVTGTITLTSGALLIRKNLTISGPGAANLFISGGQTNVYSNGNNVFSILPGVTVNISGVTIEKGRPGIYNQGTLTLTDSTVSGNGISNSYGAGIVNFPSAAATLTNSTVSGNWTDIGGGGMYNQGTLTLTNSTVSGNTAYQAGGGIYNESNGTLTLTNSAVSGNSAGYYGAGIFNRHSATLTNSTVSGNANDGIWNDYISPTTSGTLTLTNSTVSGNSANGYGGGIVNWYFATLKLTNSTVAGNTFTGNGDGGGGISSYNHGSVTLINSTVAGNTARHNGSFSNGDGILMDNTITLTLKSTILANNGSANCFVAAPSGISDGYNLSDDNSCARIFILPSDRNNTPAGLDPNGLKNNGGPTQTIALLPSSVAVDAIPVSPVNYCTDVTGNPITTDQRGITRPQGPACDIGAFELVQADAPINATGTQFGATEGVSFTGMVATFTGEDSGSTATEYSAMIDWGDSTPTTSGTISGPPGGPFIVSGTHTYAEQGTYSVKVTITDVDNPENNATAISTANVGDGQLVSTCATMPVSTQTYSGPTATFTDQSSTGTPSDFSATIDWGDGSSSAGMIAGGPGNNPYTVSGTHAYASTGTFLISTTIVDVGGSTTTTACSVTIFAFPTATGAFVIGDLTDPPPIITDPVTWWSSQWAKLNPMSGGPAPASMKGFSGYEDNLLGLSRTCGSSWATDTGNATPPPPSVPAFMGVLVSSMITQNGSVIAGNIKQVVVVHNNPGYAPDPGHPGSGTIVAIACVSP